MGSDVGIVDPDGADGVPGGLLRGRVLDSVGQTGQHLVVAADADEDRRHTTRDPIRAVYDWRHPLTAILGVLLMEFGDSR